MSNAFKCDICFKYVDGKANVIEFIPSKFRYPEVVLDLCDKCYSRMKTHVEKLSNGKIVFI